MTKTFLKRNTTLGILFFCLITNLFAQQIIQGKITDANTGEALGFVNVFIKGSQNKTTSDFEGYYKLVIDKPHSSDSITFSNIGYKSQKKRIPVSNATLDIQLESVLLETREVVIRPKENTSYKLVELALKNKDKVDRSELRSYEYKTYKRIELDVNQISGKMKKRKSIREVAALLDSTQKVNGENSKPILPFYVAEKLGKNYIQNKPLPDTKEIVNAEKINGFGLGDASTLKQLIETAFLEFNFNKNWVKVANKDLVSPISDSWKIFYDYTLTDSMFIGNEWCYRLDVTPKNYLDPVFSGHIWIADSSWAVKQLDLTLDKSANINFIDQIKIKQELERTKEGIYIPIKTRILVDLAEPTDSSTGLLAKYYVHNYEVKSNQDYEQKFWRDNLVDNTSSKNQDPNYWEKNRPEKLTPAEQNVYKMIDTIKSLPTVKNYIEIFDIALNGYYRTKYFYIGPYPNIIGYNNVEGLRLRLGVKTNPNFSKKITLSQYVAYGLKDQKIKYNTNFTSYLSRRNWTTLTLVNSFDVEQLGLYNELPGQFANSPLFIALSSYGTLKKPYWHSESHVILEREFQKGIIFGAQIRHFKFTTAQPQFGNDFSYYVYDNDKITDSIQDINTSEFTIYSRLSKREMWIRQGNERVSLGVANAPVLNLYFSKSLGKISYSKYQATLLYRMKTGVIGNTRFFGMAGLVQGTVPFPLLEAHLGNKSYVFNNNSFNMMNFFEFVSDKYLSFNIEHQFGGIFFNRVPLLKKLKWREVATTSWVWGNVSQKNKDIIVNFNQNPQFNSLNPNIPYGEISYGIENIKKVFRIDFFHRLTYLDVPYKIRKTGFKFSFQFIL